MHVLLVYPNWWFGLPAPGVALRLRRTGGIEPLLTKIQRIGVVTTYGSPRWLLLAGRTGVWSIVRSGRYAPGIARSTGLH
jgi:NAD(P)H dehydrogenase (quinone)